MDEIIYRGAFFFAQKPSFSLYLGPRWHQTFHISLSCIVVMSSEAVVNLVSDMEPIEIFDEDDRGHVQDIEQQSPPEEEEEEVRVVLDDEYYESQDSGYFSLTLEDEEEDKNDDDNDDNKKNIIVDDDANNEKIDQVLQGVVDIQHKVSTTNDLISGMKDVMSPPAAHPHPPPGHQKKEKKMISPIQCPMFHPERSFSELMFDSICIIVLSGQIGDYGRVIGKRGSRIDSLREKHQVEIALNRKDIIDHFPYICINYKTHENRWRGVNAAEDIRRILEGSKKYHPQW